MGDVKPDSVPVLSSAAQYADWASKMKGYLMFAQCWDVIASSDTPPTDGDDAKEWKKHNGQACGLIFMRTSPSFHYLLETKTTTAADGTTSSKAATLTAKEMWEALKDKFGKPNSAHVWGLFETLIGEPRMSDQRSLQDQMSRIVTRIREISTNGLELKENIQALILLSKVPDSYRSMISALMATTALDKITVDVILEKTLSEEAMRKTGQSAARISKTKPKPTGPCGHCGSPTHHESTCYKKHPELRPKGNGGRKKDKGKGKDTSNNHAHVAAPAANVLVAESVAGESSAAAPMHASFYGAANAAGVKLTRWLMDSGASQHVTFDFADFATYKAYDNPVCFSTAGSGSVVNGLGEGTINAGTVIDGVKWNITLPNVCYVPKASTRLFSTGTIERNGYSLFQGDGKMTIFDKLPKGSVVHGATISIPGRKVLEACYQPRSNLYELELEIADSLKLDLHVRSYKTWHRRFGHAGKEAISKLPKSVKGVDAVDPADVEPCEGCAFGKSHRQPFSPSDKRASEVLELVHTDLDGPMRTRSINGYSYFAGFIDDHSGLARVYFLKHKSDAFRAFDDYKAWAENQTGKKIKRVRSDRGGEYTSKEFTDHLRKHGIEHHKTVAKSPQQNGRAERWNRTVVEKAMSMLHQAGLSHGFWQLAVEAAVHIYNRQPMRRLKWCCPITVWDGTVPDVSYFRVFGCKAYVHVQKSERAGKLDKKAVEMIFVGYEAGSKGYKFWNPATRSIVVSRDVTFDEESFPARQISGNRPVTPDDSPFPEYSESPDDASNADFDDVLPHLPLPDPPLPEDHERPPSPPPAPPAPAPEPAPVMPERPPTPPPVPPPRPAHQRQRHQPVGGPSIARDRPRRENVKVPERYRDSVYGDLPPAQVDAEIDEDGEQQAETLLAFLAASQYKAGLPNNHREAMRSPDAEKWKLAEQKEYNSLIENKTWILVPRPKDRQVVANRWVYDIKHDGRYKARLVAKGFTQVWGEDYNETFSPVARFESIRYLFAHATLNNWYSETMDVETAFLNGDLDQVIYMEQPEGWAVRGKENYVCLLKKAIYGLKQASRQWNIC